MPEWLYSVINSSLAATVLRIVVIVLLALVGSSGLRLATRRMEHHLAKTVTDVERWARMNTLLQVGRNVALVLISIAAGLMTLYTLEIDTGPLLAGAGIAGLALSLGAQTLIKDYIGGILILVEDQFRVGDVVKVGNVSGSVERIALRATYLRDADGKLVIVPNGDIRQVSNLTAGWAQASVNLNVEFEADMNKVMHALQVAAQKAQADESIKSGLLEPPKAVGWVGFNDWAMQVQLTAKTAPGKQWGVAMALRKYAVEALQAEGIRIALPVRQDGLVREA